MYPGDNREVLALNGGDSAQVSSQAHLWVYGSNHGDPNTLTNTQYLVGGNYALFAPTLRSPLIYKCPADISTWPVGGKKMKELLHRDCHGKRDAADPIELDLSDLFEIHRHCLVVKPLCVHGCQPGQHLHACVRSGHEPANLRPLSVQFSSRAGRGGFCRQPRRTPQMDGFKDENRPACRGAVYPSQYFLGEQPGFEMDRRSDDFKIVLRASANPSSQGFAGVGCVTALDGTSPFGDDERRPSRGGRLVGESSSLRGGRFVEASSGLRGGRFINSSKRFF